MAVAPETTGERRIDARAWIAPVAALLILIAALSTVIFLSNRTAGTDAPPPAGPFAFPTPGNSVLAYDVGEVFSDRIRLDLPGGSSAPASGSSREITLATSTRWEFLQPATFADIDVGDSIQVVAVPNQVRTFHIRSIVIMPEGSTTDADGVIRSPGGFGGHEASRDANERPVMGGAVVSKSSDSVTLDGPTGPITVTLLEGAPIRAIIAGEPGAVADGDRVAFAATEGQPESVIILPGGARE